MIRALARRLLLGLAVLLGVNVLTFALFFFAHTPSRAALAQLGPEATVEQLDDWQRARSYHLPYFFHDGWQREATRAMPSRAGGWLDLGALPPGDGAVVIEVDEPRRSGGAVPLPELASEPSGAAVFGAGGRVHVSDPRGARIKARIASEYPSGTRVMLLRYRVLRPLERLTNTLFFQRSLRFLWLDFGRGDDDTPIAQTLRDRARPTLAITVPALALGLVAELTVALLLTYFRGTAWDVWGSLACVVAMASSTMLYVIVGQWWFANTLRWAPISGFSDGPGGVRFVVLPIAIGAAVGLGSGARWYRAIFVAELRKDYVRTARAGGLPESVVLGRHVLPNALIPIVTSVAGAIPFLFTGSVVLESFFAIPGMGAFLLEALRRQDFSAVQATVFAASALQVAVVLVTDLAYVVVDPRVRITR